MSKIRHACTMAVTLLLAGTLIGTLSDVPGAPGTPTPRPLSAGTWCC
jgi:hypothetical protein